MIATAVAFAVASLLGFVAVHVGPAIGALDRPGGTAIKPHAVAIPRLGGVVVVGGLIAGLVVAGWPLPLAGTIAIGAAFALGLVDDAVGVAPLVRLAMQFGLGLAIAAGGLAAEALPGTALSWIVGAVVFAATLNAVKMIDGVDGLAATAGAITALGLALVAAGAGHEGPMQLSLVVGGAVAGFLVHNLPPARLVLGANGVYAMAAGLAVAILIESRTAAGLIGAATCLGLFGVDLLLWVLRRIVGGAAGAAGDAHHVDDGLRARGLSVRRTLAVCTIVHVSFVALGVRIAGTSTTVAVVTMTAAWLVTAVWLLWSGLVTGGAPDR